MKTKNIQFEYYNPKQCTFGQPLLQFVVYCSTVAKKVTLGHL
jgi:hypothetical protein